MRIRYLYYKNAKKRALTMSYDDGQRHDLRLLDIFNAHGIRGSFHLNSGLFGGSKLTAEEVSTVVNVMIEQDFANHPTWNPEERTGFDGSSTDIFAAGNFGNGWEAHLISMWEPEEKHPHYHIRTAIENLVRAHITVEEGRIYRPDLYEEYDWMQ